MPDNEAALATETFCTTLEVAALCVEMARSVPDVPALLRGLKCSGTVPVAITRLREDLTGVLTDAAAWRARVIELEKLLRKTRGVLGSMVMTCAGPPMEEDRAHMAKLARELSDEFKAALDGEPRQVAWRAGVEAAAALLRANANGRIDDRVGAELDAALQQLAKQKAP